MLATDLLGPVGQVDDVGLGGELDGGAPYDVVTVVGAGDGHLVDEDPDDLPALMVREVAPGRAGPTMSSVSDDWARSNRADRSA